MKKLIIKSCQDRVVAIIQQTPDLKYQVTTSSELLKLAFDYMLQYGFSVHRYASTLTSPGSNPEILYIQAQPTDSDMLEKLKQYLELSFDYHVTIHE